MCMINRKSETLITTTATVEQIERVLISRHYTMIYSATRTSAIKRDKDRCKTSQITIVDQGNCRLCIDLEESVGLFSRPDKNVLESIMAEVGVYKIIK